jgi:uncharacterized delta-60 repeat protein
MTYIRTFLLAAALTLLNATPPAWAETTQTAVSLDERFNPNVTGGEGFVCTMAVQPDGKIIIGGNFTSVDGAEHNNLARLNADGSVDASFTASVDYTVNGVAVQPDGKIVLGGTFTHVNGEPHNYLARLEASGKVDGCFDLSTSGPSGAVRSIALQTDGKILFAGAFNGPGKNMARLNANGRLDASFNPTDTNGAGVLWVAVQPDGKIVLVGDFTIPHNRIARLNAGGSVDDSFNPGTGANDLVYSVVVQPDGKKILVGGSFTEVNGNPRDAFARLDAGGALLAESVAFGGHGAVVSMAMQADGKIVLGGSSGIIRINADGGVDDSFHPTTGGNPAVRNVTLQPDGKILLGGDFTSVNGTTRNAIARLKNEVSAQAQLEAGNQRYAAGKATHPDQSVKTRKEVAAGQHPFAVIVGCADSRVPPEIVFDHGLGDLFVIRIAGEVLDKSSLGSIEYAVEHFHPVLIVVLGHERCGAVEAAVNYDPHADPEHPVSDQILYLINAIKPAVVHGNNETETIELSVKQNARQVAAQIRTDLDEEHLDKEKKVSIITGYYDLDTGKVIYYQ